MFFTTATLLLKSSLLIVGAISAHIVRTFPDLILFQLIESLILAVRLVLISGFFVSDLRIFSFLTDGFQQRTFKLLSFFNYTKFHLYVI